MCPSPPPKLSRQMCGRRSTLSPDRKTGPSPDFFLSRCHASLLVYLLQICYKWHFTVPMCQKFDKKIKILLRPARHYSKKTARLFHKPGGKTSYFLYFFVLYNGLHLIAVHEKPADPSHSQSDHNIQDRVLLQEHGGGNDEYSQHPGAPAHQFVLPE